MSVSVRKIILFCLPFAAVACMVACNINQNNAVSLDIAAEPFEKLSDYHFFEGVMNKLQPNKGIIPYDLVTPLFTDYAHKARFVYVPEGKSAEYDSVKALQFPLGSCLIKNFYYPDDFRNPGGHRRIIETRLLMHRVNGWEAFDYIWNKEQSEARLEDAGDIQKVSWIHNDGTKREADYVIPTKNQCKGCHWNNSTAMTPIGPKVRNLNRDFAYAEGTENQLMHLAKAGFIKNLPTQGIWPKLADWADSVHYSANDRARAYLDVNCGHCHNPKGPAYTSGLHLNLENDKDENLGICKSPVAAGKGTGGRMSDIVPGHPDRSIVIYRISSTDAGIKMPELGRGLVHTEGLDLITKWIAEMKPSDCTVR